VLKSVSGHLVVVGIDPHYSQQLDERLNDLLACATRTPPTAGELA